MLWSGYRLLRIQITKNIYFQDPAYRQKTFPSQESDTKIWQSTCFTYEVGIIKRYSNRIFSGADSNENTGVASLKVVGSTHRKCTGPCSLPWKARCRSATWRRSWDAARDWVPAQRTSATHRGVPVGVANKEQTFSAQALVAWCVRSLGIDRSIENKIKQLTSYCFYQLFGWRTIFPLRCATAQHHQTICAVKYHSRAFATFRI